MKRNKENLLPVDLFFFFFHSRFSLLYSKRSYLNRIQIIKNIHLGTSGWKQEHGKKKKISICNKISPFEFGKLCLMIEAKKYKMA